MIPNRNTRISLDEFLERRGIEKNNFHLNENSVLLQKILMMKGHKTKNYNQFRPNYTLNNFYTNHNTKRKIFLNRLQKRTKEYKIFNENNNQKKNTIYNNFVSNLGIISKEKENNNNLNEENNYDNLSINCNLFSDTLNGKNEVNKEYIFHTSTKLVDISNESILNRINRNNDSKYNNSNDSFNNRFFETTYKIRANNLKKNFFKTNKKLVYKKKINTDKFKKKKPLSRNRISLLFPENNNSKENSICTSIDFSIINKGSDINKSNFFSTTNENFYILSKNTNNANKTNNKTVNNNQIKIRNIKFLNHFIKYCYLYYIIIVKKFFNNLKKIKLETFSELSHLISNHKNNKLFEEFNKDDFDRETINYKTSENFYTDGINLSNISANKNNNNKNFVYNRRKRISNQNYQTKNLMKILNDSKIENEKSISNYDNTKYSFDNENDKNDKYNKDTNKEINNDNEKSSPFFNGKNNYSDNINNNDKLNFSKNIIKSNNSEMKDNIIGFIQINNEINPFKIKNSHINFFDEAKNQILEKSIQQNEEEILSFRQKNPEINNNQNNFQSLINILNTKTEDNKLFIDIKYLPNTNYKQNSNKFKENELNIEKNSFQIYNKRIKKISVRVKDSRLIKEKEDYIDLNNNENRKNYLYSLSIIKEEDDEKYINDSSLQKKIPLKKIDYYFNLSNNSKLISKTSIEKLIDGDKIIKEEDMDNILDQSSSRYNRNKNKSQEIMVVSNFSSIMRNRIHRKENAKSLINGILILIEFFGSLCFDIRKNTYFKLKMNWKIRKMIYYIKRYALKKSYKIIKFGINI